MTAPMSPCPRCGGAGVIRLYKSLRCAIRRGWTCQYVRAQYCDWCRCVCGQPPVTPGGLCQQCDDAAWLREDSAFRRRADR
jgi:hypothetical protein